jgi:uncharacterized protein YjbI with pentapeptide repeats
MSEQTETRPRQYLSWVVIPLLLLNIALAAWLVIEIRPASQAQSTTASTVQSMDKAALETEKLRQEVRQLTLENERLAGSWQAFSSFAALLTAGVAVAGVFVTIWRQFEERRKDRQQREFESRRRLDEKFTSIVTNLSSDNRSLQMSSAVSLLTFLKPEYSAFHEQVYLILLANLKLRAEPQINDLLVDAFQKVVRIRLGAAGEAGGLTELDFSHTNLYRIDLSGLDLNGLDIGFADLRHANLRDANLFRVRGIEANLEKTRLTRAKLGEARLVRANLREAHLHQANLVAATLKETNLRGAQFFQAQLQSAHLEKADVSGARFEQADLKDTYFTGATFDGQALASILKAGHWDKAHFDEEIAAKLAELNAKD